MEGIPAFLPGVGREAEQGQEEGLRQGDGTPAEPCVRLLPFQHVFAGRAGAIPSAKHGTSCLTPADAAPPANPSNLSGAKFERRDRPEGSADDLILGPVRE